MNEELSTVNRQLADKVAELAATNDELANLLSSTQIATLFLDTDLRVKRFTPITQRLLNLIAADAGRPIGEIGQKFTGGDLQQDARRVLCSVAPLECEVCTEEGETYLRRILPYHTADNRLGGVVVTFIDITERNRNVAALRHSEQSLRELIDSAPDAMVVADAGGIIGVVNAQTERLLGYDKEQLIGQPVEMLLPHRFREGHAQYRARYLDAPKVREMGSGTELFCLTSDGREIPIEVSLSPIRTEKGLLVSAAIRDITERQRAQASLRAAKALAESALATKSRFLATASHDLRQPLQSLMLLNAALLRLVDEPRARETIRAQGESLTGMSRLLGSLLDISKLDSGTVTVDRKNFAVRPLLEQLCADLGAEAEQKGLRLVLAAPDVAAYSDPVLLSQLLQNLMSNAIRYTDSGQVKLACERHGDRLRFSVSDTGAGIDEDQLTEIFAEFHQTERGPRDRRGGLGLGLAIVERISALLETQTKVESEVGAGSCFSLETPVGAFTFLASVARAESDDVPVTGSGTILVVDDEAAVLDAAELLLTIEGFNVVAAASAAEARAVLNKLLPDLIVTDFHLDHDESGVDIIRGAREQAGGLIPAILITGDTSAPIAQLNIEKVQVMIKPLNVEELLSAVRKLLRAGVTGGPPGD